MERIDEALDALSQLGGLIVPVTVPTWVRFITMLVFWAAVLVLVLIAIHLSLGTLRRGIRSAARSLARGASTDTVRRLEASSAALNRWLGWLQYRALRTSLGTGNSSPERMPVTGETTWLRSIARLALRMAWMTVVWAVVWLNVLPRAALGATGLTVIALAFATVAPELVSAAATGLVALLQTFPWSLSIQTTIATLASLIAVSVVGVKVLISDRAYSSREFRRRRDEKALELLHDMSPAIGRLAGALDEYLDEAVRAFDVERTSAHSWFVHHSPQGPEESTTKMSPAWLDRHHERCTPECVEEAQAYGRSHDAPLPPEIGSAVEKLGDASRIAGLRGHRTEFARILNRRAWEGLVSLTWAPSLPRATALRLPHDKEWRRRRIQWQHDHIWGISPGSRGQEPLSLRLTVDPDTGWLEDELLDQVWHLAELARELRQLSEYGRAVNVTRRSDVLLRAVRG